MFWWIGVKVESHHLREWLVVENVPRQETPLHLLELPTIFTEPFVVQYHV
jgi:hypothetical protein